MDHTGKLPSNRMLDAFKDEATMKKIYDPILAFAISKKAWIKQFWDSADNTKSGLMENGVVIGQTWDRSEEHTSELQSLMRISYAVFCLKKKKHYQNHTHRPNKNNTN